DAHQQQNIYYTYAADELVNLGCRLSANATIVCTYDLPPREFDYFPDFNNYIDLVHYGLATTTKREKICTVNWDDVKFKTDIFVYGNRPFCSQGNSFPFI
ncbi:hypothetical protein Leryth_013999, partial [Lithospermum erythrorhizon]